MKYLSNYRKYSSYASNIVILINLSLLDYHDLIISSGQVTTIREGALIRRNKGFIDNINTI